MKIYIKSYEYRNRQKDLEEFKAKVVKVLHARLNSKLSFAEISRALGLPDRTIAFKIYEANRNNTELVKIASFDK